MEAISDSKSAWSGFDLVASIINLDKVMIVPGELDTGVEYRV